MHFVAAVYYGGHVLMSDYNIRISMTTATVDNSANNIAFERIKYFIYHEIDSTVFIHRDEEAQCKKLTDAGISITTLPDQPVDQIIGMMLFCKLNAITEDKLIITQVEISSDAGENVVYLHDENESIGPFEESGWWHSSDLSHYELNLGDNIVDIGNTNSWRDLELHWDDVEPVAENTIVFADFKRDDNK